MATIAFELVFLLPLLRPLQTVPHTAGRVSVPSYLKPSNTFFF